jgi:hypothetical protein
VLKKFFQDGSEDYHFLVIFGIFRFVVVRRTAD